MTNDDNWEQCSASDFSCTDILYSLALRGGMWHFLTRIPALLRRRINGGDVDPAAQQRRDPVVPLSWGNYSASIVAEGVNKCLHAPHFILPHR